MERGGVCAIEITLIDHLTVLHDQGAGHRSILALFDGGGDGLGGLIGEDKISPGRSGDGAGERAEQECRFEQHCEKLHDRRNTAQRWTCPLREVT